MSTCKVGSRGAGDCSEACDGRAQENLQAEHTRDPVERGNGQTEDRECVNARLEKALQCLSA